ncbi:MAG TPA: outer membrane protein assembly factor BamE [Caldimonas sp.]|nr:outer membrane protein assembly factor BamE [Caldimonas sp.]
MRATRLRCLARHAALAGAALLAGCQFLPSADRTLGPITPYRIEVVQGNVVTKEQAALVRPGMTRAQVRDALGSPLLADPFHADRWDYVFTIRRQGTPPQLHSVVVLFENDVLKSIDTNGELPAEREFVASIDTNKRPNKIPNLALTDEEKKALPAPVRQPAAEAVPDVAARAYPPLEPTAP